MEQFELIMDVSTKEAIVSDGNETDSSFGEIDSENEVKNGFFKVIYRVSRQLVLTFDFNS